MIAPHPDDDVLAAGGLIQRVTAGGGRVRVLFLTAGENNSWAQRATLRRWTISEADRGAWSRLRMDEAVDALSVLGVPRMDVEQLGLRDQGLVALARAGAPEATAAIAEVAHDFAPTLTVAPSMFDLHGDHRAAALYAHHALGREMRIVTYVIHGAAPQSRRTLSVQLSVSERRQKLRAIARHQTQVRIGHNRYLSYGQRDENFYRDEHDLVRSESVAQEYFGRMRHSMHAVFATAAGAVRARIRA